MKAVRLSLSAVCLGLALTPQANAAEVFMRDFSKFGANYCPNDTYCQISFGTVPANRVYEIKSVSCYAGQNNVNGSILYWYFTAVAQPTQYGQIHLRPTRLGISTTTLTWNATESALVRAPAGANLYAVLQGAGAGGISSLQCTIAGEIYSVQ